MLLIHYKRKKPSEIHYKRRNAFADIPLFSFFLNLNCQNISVHCLFVEKLYCSVWWEIVPFFPYKWSALSVKLCILIPFYFVPFCILNKDLDLLIFVEKLYGKFSLVFLNGKRSESTTGFSSGTI